MDKRISNNAPNPKCVIDKLTSRHLFINLFIYYYSFVFFYGNQSFLKRNQIIWLALNTYSHVMGTLCLLQCPLQLITSVTLDLIFFSFLEYAVMLPEAWPSRPCLQIAALYIEWVESRNGQAVNRLSHEPAESGCYEKITSISSAFVQIHWGEKWAH